MTYAYNDVQNAKAGYTLEDTGSETADGDFDLGSWTALKKAMSMAEGLGPEPVVSMAEQAIHHVNSVGKAASKLSQAQSVANVHIMSDNFVRDSITGK